MSIVGFVNSVELIKYIPAPCFRIFYSHVFKPTSLFHLEEIFLLSLVCILLSRGVAKDVKNNPLPNNLTTPTATQQDSFFSVYIANCVYEAF